MTTTAIRRHPVTAIRTAATPVRTRWKARRAARYVTLEPLTQMTTQRRHVLRAPLAPTPPKARRRVTPALLATSTSTQSRLPHAPSVMWGHSVLLVPSVAQTVRPANTSRLRELLPPQTVSAAVLARTSKSPGSDEAGDCINCMLASTSRRQAATRRPTASTAQLAST